MANDKDKQDDTIRSSLKIGGNHVDQRVTSHGQLGGITAHTVNIGRQGRNLAQLRNLTAQILREIPKSRRLTVTVVMGDTEAMDFAEQILAFLKANGYQADGFNTIMSAQPIKGLQLKNDEDPWEFIVGSAER